MGGGSGRGSGREGVRVGDATTEGAAYTYKTS